MNSELTSQIQSDSAIHPQWDDYKIKPADSSGFKLYSNQFNNVNVTYNNTMGPSWDSQCSGQIIQTCDSPNLKTSGCTGTWGIKITPPQIHEYNKAENTRTCDQNSSNISGTVCNSTGCDDDQLQGTVGALCLQKNNSLCNVLGKGGGAKQGTLTSYKVKTPMTKYCKYLEKAGSTKDFYTFDSLISNKYSGLPMDAPPPAVTTTCTYPISTIPTREQLVGHCTSQNGRDLPDKDTKEKCDTVSGKWTPSKLMTIKKLPKATGDPRDQNAQNTYKWNNLKDTQLLRNYCWTRLPSQELPPIAQTKDAKICNYLMTDRVQFNEDLVNYCTQELHGYCANNDTGENINLSDEDCKQSALKHLKISEYGENNGLAYRSIKSERTLLTFNKTTAFSILSFDVETPKDAPKGLFGAKCAEFRSMDLIRISGATMSGVNTKNIAMGIVLSASLSSSLSTKSCGQHLKVLLVLLNYSDNVVPAKTEYANSGQQCKVFNNVKCPDGYANGSQLDGRKDCDCFPHWIFGSCPKRTYMRCSKTIPGFIKPPEILSNNLVGHTVTREASGASVDFDDTQRSITFTFKFEEGLGLSFQDFVDLHKGSDAQNGAEYDMLKSAWENLPPQNQVSQIITKVDPPPKSIPSFCTKTNPNTNEITFFGTLSKIDKEITSPGTYINRTYFDFSLNDKCMGENRLSFNFPTSWQKTNEGITNGCACLRDQALGPFTKIEAAQDSRNLINTISLGLKLEVSRVYLL